jgi:hypothetical protein
MVDPRDAVDQARSLVAGVTIRHRITLPREWRRRAIPSRSARVRDVTMAVCRGGVWLDVSGKAGVLFDADEWAQLALEAIALLVEIAPATPDAGL